MKVRPLTGQVLIEVLPLDTRTAGGIELPQRSLSPEEVQERHANPEKPAGVFGIVREIGPWPKLKCGMMQMPEFGLGQRVVINPAAGQYLAYGVKSNLKLVGLDQVLAVIL